MITDIWHKLKNTTKPILIYGTGNGADRVIDEMTRLGIPISGVFASDGFVRERVFRGFKVTSYQKAKEEFGDFIALMSFGSNRSDVIENVKRIKSETEIYCIDVPVYGDNIFNLSFAKAHKGEIEETYNSLYDEKSKRIYESIIKFKLTGDTDYLFSCETEESEAFENILSLGANETYLDLGAFNGDTVLKFIECTKSYNSIIAVEPSEKNFIKIQKNLNGFSNITLINAMISDTIGQLPFSNHGGRNASVGGNASVKSMTVDSILNSSPVTYIKFDVEGQEKNAIIGAEQTIANYKPKMLISCYHRSEDIFTLPLQVLKIRPDYNVHIRHYPYLPAWDTQFYFT